MKRGACDLWVVTNGTYDVIAQESAAANHQNSAQIRWRDGCERHGGDVLNGSSNFNALAVQKIVPDVKPVN